ncbi:MAG: flippase-like domain-containing protein [Deltaproteobacteria bacterium]|nr:flippase-like domain-containing protein [Deltaproteobacteria bacterium]
MKRLVPWIVTAVIFALIFRRVPIARVVDALRSVDVLAYLAIMLPYSIVYLLIDTFCLTRVINWFNTTIAYRDVLPIRATTYLLTLLNSPLGQGSIALYLNRRDGIPLLEVASSVLFMMFVELYQLVFFSSLGAAIAPRRIDGLCWVYVALYVYFGAHVAFFRLAGDRLTQDKAAGMLRSFRLAHLRHYLLLVLFKAPNFLMATIVYYYALQCFGLHLSYLELLVFLPVIFLSAALPIGVAHLGAPQYFWLHFFGDQAPEASLLAFSLTAHVTFMVMNATLGVPFLPRATRELS